jgi:hypothetical protein
MISMSESTRSPRQQLVREAAVLQLKLLVDGIRDALLIPVSLVAALIGLVRGGPDADREFRHVLKLGRRSERWINLFGHRPPLLRSHPGGSLDMLLDRVEETVMEQYRKGRNVEEARNAISAALQEKGNAPAGPDA